jgi:cytochrome c
MRSGYLIPLLLAGVLALSGCGGEAPAPAQPAPSAMQAPSLSELPAPYSAASVEQGKSLFGRKCGSCHYIQADKGNLVGPNLHGLFERGVGKTPNYNYSPALKNFEHKDWAPDLIDQWLIAPQGFVPGTAMFFNGLKEPIERRDLIAYLLIASRQ